MRKPKLPKKPKAPKASAGIQAWKNYLERLKEWKKKCAAKMKPYNEFVKIREQAKKAARGY